MNGTFIYKFLAVLKKKKILGNICFSKQIFYRKQSLGGTDTIPNSFSWDGYCHIWAIWVCAAVKGMVFKQFTLG